MSAHISCTDCVNNCWHKYISMKNIDWMILQNHSEFLEHQLYCFFDQINISWDCDQNSYMLDSDFLDFLIEFFLTKMQFIVSIKHFWSFKWIINWWDQKCSWDICIHICECLINQKSDEVVNSQQNVSVLLLWCETNRVNIIQVSHVYRLQACNE